ncbi:amidase [Kordiimonas pumila]|uniref:Amidase n=1 Tax=Kordiimonas pumila TaxID=2161677 RepID=A0ABV7D5N6_9PROT|nr:amidase [Kordiimonas pumila]
MSSANNTEIEQPQTDVGTVFVAEFDLGDSGYTVALKDVIDIKGFPTKAGSAAFNTRNPARVNASIVENLLSSGCRIVGKTTLHELAYGVTGMNAWAGTPVNFNYPDLIPGGSSSGSAVAVAANLCDFSIGTDTGGSIRLPAACCGVYGIKPTFGRLSRHGLTPNSSSLDCVGPFAASAQMLHEAMRCLDPCFAALPDISGLSIGWLDVKALPEIQEGVQAKAAILNPDMKHLSSSLIEDAHMAGITIMAHEMSELFAPLVETGLLGPDIAERLKLASGVTANAVADAERVRVAFTKELNTLFETYDVLALPTLPYFPPRVEDATDMLNIVSITSLTRPFNLSGHPAIALPAGSLNGKPLSLQLVAPKGMDERLIAFAVEYDRRLKSTPDQNLIN